MIQVVEDSDIEDMTIKDNYIIIMCKKISAEIIKSLGKSQNKVGIFYRNGYVLDTVNGIISKISRNKNIAYELVLYPLQENMLKNIKDYEMFFDFLIMRNFFKEYFKISLYWDETNDICTYEKTTPIDKFGGSSLDNAFRSIRQINVNAKTFPKIRLLPDLEEILKAFVNETKVGKFYTD